MTNRPANPRVRRAARLLALTPALLVTTTAGAAFADPPDSWENNPDTSTMQVLLVLVGFPLALFVLITLLVYVPSMARGERATQTSAQTWRGEAEWFGGPRQGLEAVDTAERRPALSDGGSGPTRGGDSGHW